MCTNAIHHDAHTVDQVVKLLRHQAELFEYFRQFQDLFLSGSVAAAFRFNGVTRYNVLSAQFSKFFASQLRVDAVVIVGTVVVGIFFVFIFVIVRSSWESSEPT